MKNETNLASKSSKKRAKQLRTQRNPIKGVAMKTRKDKMPETQKDKTLQVQYQKLFTSFPLPYNGLYTDEDSLEQPSAFKYVLTNATPSIVS